MSVPDPPAVSPLLFQPRQSGVPVVPPLPVAAGGSPLSTTAPGSRFLRPQDLRRFQNFQFAAKMIVEGFYSGRHRSPFHDPSAEFADYRPYVPGDELRSLDWRAYARTDRDYIKLFRKETDMRCHVLLDTSRSMAFRDVPESEVVTVFGSWQQSKGGWKSTTKPAASDADTPLTKYEYGAYLTAALCYLMIRQGDKAGLALGAADLEAFVPPGGTITHLHSLLYHLEGRRVEAPQTEREKRLQGTASQHPEEDSEGTHLARALRSLFALTRRRGLLVVISDFLEEEAPLFDALSMYTHRGWQILLLHVLTDAELNLPGDGPMRYLDAEGPGALDADPDALRSAYQAEVRAWLDALETQCKARRLHYARMTTSTPYDRALERYLTVHHR